MRNYEYVQEFAGGSGERERVAEWQGRYYTHKLQIVELAIFSPCLSLSLAVSQMEQLNNRAAPQVRVGLIFHPRG